MVGEGGESQKESNNPVKAVVQRKLAIGLRRGGSWETGQETKDEGER